MPFPKKPKLKKPQLEKQIEKQKNSKTSMGVSPRHASLVYKGMLPRIKEVLKNLKKILSKEEFNKLKKQVEAHTKQGLVAFKSELNKLKNVKGAKISDSSMKFIMQLGKITTILTKRYEQHQESIVRRKRAIEEKQIKEKYKKTSIEGFKFREWTQNDVKGFSKFVTKNASTNQLLTKLLKKNSYLWNPKGNPKLYMNQQCAEVAILLLVHYCYKNKINLVLPIGNTYSHLSNYKTVEDFMSHTYKRFSASHLFNGGGGLFTRVDKKDVQPGDIVAKKHEKGGFHGQMAVKAPDKEGKIQVIQGGQMNKDFRKTPEVRKKVEKIYPIGFVKAQPDVKPKDVKMHYGGYAVKPGVSYSIHALNTISFAGVAPDDTDEIRYFRVNAKRMAQFAKLNQFF